MIRFPSVQDALADSPIEPRSIALLIGLLGLTVIPHFSNVNGWIMLFFLLASGVRLLMLFRPSMRIGRWVLGLLVLLAVANVIVNEGLGDGRRAGTALLIVMLGLKLLELKDRRDLYISVFLGYFLVITQFLYSQDMQLSIYLFVLVYVLTTLLVALNQVRPGIRQSLAGGARLLLSALPVMVIMFVLFPRLDSPLWNISVDRQVAVTGISDKLSPGSVGALSQSQAVAFRVRFNDRAPPPENRYWRGPVLWQTDGKTWTAGYGERLQRPAQIAGARPVDYEIIMEPSGQYWLFPLDVPSFAPALAKRTADLGMVTEQPVEKRVSFRTSSFLDYRFEEENPRDLSAALALPAGVSSRVRALADSWVLQHGSGNAPALVQAALDHFSTEDFYYTLQPGVIEGDVTDTFLFETRRGFCEHYASSFAILMRLAGVPARVVVGYQGGTLNPHAGHWVIRQSDAHAWTEVWLAGRGWTRVDPTAAVAPERVLQSIDPDRSSEQGRVVFQVGSDGILSALLREGRWLADAVDIGWHRWVVGFTAQRQSSLLSGLGLGFLSGYWQGVAMVSAVVVALVGAMLLLRVPGGLGANNCNAEWRIFRRKLHSRGTVTPDWMGPLDTARLACARHPGQCREIEDIAGLYIGIRYGNTDVAGSLKRLRRLVRRLKLDKAD